MQLRFFEALAEATDKAALHNALHVIANEMDFGRFTLLWFNRCPPRSDVGLTVSAGGAYIHNTPDAFMEQASSPELSMVDPVFQHIVNSPRPLIYDQSTYVKVGAADLWDAQAPFGYKTGIAIAMNVGSRRAVFGCDRDGPVPKDPATLAYLVSQATMTLSYAQETDRIVLGSEEPLAVLTPQRIHILRLIAEGKSDSVIAQLLGITKYTVNFHVRNIFRTLGVSSRAQAIVKGAPYLKIAA